ncbi:hypothetical protein EW146_g9946 [Bondarzewia mesenterica]|uniref:Homeobox domain-containing protein n=1 Tax=Bondarzewia mesenterica TaxID=1095465 RepID=A0A4S4L227_9AGAM|nr:hypothetical protein EW146_g9946 [Bondarzewia mesenterica]
MGYLNLSESSFCVAVVTHNVSVAFNRRLADFFDTVSHNPTAEQKIQLLARVHVSDPEYSMNSMYAWFRRKSTKKALKQSPPSSRDILWPSITLEKEIKLKVLVNEFPSPTTDLLNMWAGVIDAQPEHVARWVEHMRHLQHVSSPPPPAAPRSSSMSSRAAHDDVMDVDPLAQCSSQLPTPSVSISPEPATRDPRHRPTLAPISFFTSGQSLRRIDTVHAHDVGALLSPPPSAAPLPPQPPLSRPSHLSRIVAMKHALRDSPDDDDELPPPRNAREFEALVGPSQQRMHLLLQKVESGALAKYGFPFVEKGSK